MKTFENYVKKIKNQWGAWIEDKRYFYKSKLNKLKYQNDAVICLEDCALNPGIKIGSESCSQCENFYKSGKEHGKGWIICKKIEQATNNSNETYKYNSFKKGDYVVWKTNINDSGIEIGEVIQITSDPAITTNGELILFVKKDNYKSIDDILVVYQRQVIYHSSHKPTLEDIEKSLTAEDFNL